MPWFYPPAIIPPQPNNLTKTFEATGRLLLIARRIMDVKWVHGLNLGFASLTRISLVVSNGLNKARNRSFALDALICDIEYVFFFWLLLLSLTSASTRLNEWKSSLTAELEITPKSQPTATPHKLMLHLAYWWLTILLHRPFFLRKSRPMHNTNREIDHVKVRNISSCEKFMQPFFPTSVMSSCCR